jgi:quinol monooxygenase YgiN
MPTRCRSCCWRTLDGSSRASPATSRSACTGSVDNPNEFWLYETWASEEAVEAHESGEAFLRYKEALRPLVEADSVLFGNCVPVKVLGFRLTD